MDRNTDFSFMKSGFNMLNEPDKPDPQMTLFITAAISSLSELALRDAAIYVKHSGRKVITKEDILRCMMNRGMSFMNAPNFMQNVQKWQNNIIEDISNPENIEDEEDLFIEEDEENNIFSESQCQCELCKKINNVKSEWESWEPFSPIEQAIKKSLPLFEL